MTKVVIAGGTGFIEEYFKQQYEVEIISRSNKYIHWDDTTNMKF